MSAKFRPPDTPPVEFGPVAKTTDPIPARPMDQYLNDLYGPQRTPAPLIEAEPMNGRAETTFPLAMWAWSAATLAAAVIATILILG